MPAFSVAHSPNLSFDNAETVVFSAYDMTRVIFMKSIPWGEDITGLMYIKDVYGMAVVLSGILMPLGLVCSVVTAVFAYISWFKGEQFKKFCFLFSLCGMVFATITLISTWFIAIQLRNGNAYIEYFNNNIKGSIAYGSFVSLILAFVIAIIACAYNYFLDNFDDEEDEEDDEEDDEEEIEEPKKKVKVVEKVEEPKAPVKTVAKAPAKTNTTKTTAVKKTTSNTSKPASTTKKAPVKKTSN